MGLDYIGPVVIDHRNPVLSWSGDNVRISGQTTVASAHLLSEMLSNPDRRQTVQDHVGVLEHIQFSGLVGMFSGWYVLDPGEVIAERPWSITPYMPFSVSGLWIRRELVVTHSSRQLANDFGLVGQSIVAAPFWNEDAGGGQMLVTIDGTTVAREYDPTT